MTFVQIDGSSPGSTVAAAQAYTTNNTAGDLLVCGVTWDSAGSRVISTVADTQLNTWSLWKVQDDTTNLQATALYYAFNCAAGANTVTVTFDGLANSTAIYVAEYSGIQTTSPTDGTATGQTASGSTATDNVTSTSLTTTVNNDTVIGSVMDTDSNATFTAGTGFTKRGSSFSGLSLEDLVQSSSGAIAATWTRSVSGRYAAIVAAFKEAASGVSPAAENATGTGTSNDATFSLSINAECATGSGVAQDITLSGSLTINAECAESTGVAPFDFGENSSGLQLISNSAIEGFGVANNPTVDLSMQSGIASVLGTANDAVIVAPAIIANSEVASGIGVAYNASILNGGNLVGITLADQARLNLLAALSLSEPQNLSNVDLMRLLLEDPLQTLVTKTSASAATHLLRYEMSLRS